ncbi:NAD(P)H-dependent oxidoreductase [Yersinia kristensenii]|uniref:NAD(P)H-dependent oxidoreductase n=1 Tax=Yersinia kristensenii TaxID=28152 RepID=UPI001C60CE7D|nr:NAD(P)H-dependent oxidoreductase [Yersinia kristensenii]MBW5811770.1 NAD(P)H-dependent oxidoreductase [Yersinia kristensenii]MBW5829032.1 NAD(P)H-dependent oxidoreductase [Yersinia kristensenii]
MSNVLIINAMKEFAHSKGALNLTLTNVAADFLQENDHQVKITTVDQGYDIENEIENYLWADTVIYQMPGWWMGEPWILKKYIDEVFTYGHGRLYQSDGRTRSDATKGYGSGGLIQGKTYMLSVTWNAPSEAFTDPNQFFEGVGVDGVYLHFHKANQFLGMESLPTFMCNDVIKQPDIEGDISRYRQHLAENFKHQAV